MPTPAPNTDEKPASKPASKSNSTHAKAESSNAASASHATSAKAKPRRASHEGKQHPRGSRGSTSGAHGSDHKKGKKKRLDPIEALFGEHLVTATKERKPTRDLLVENNVVGLYFAAKWCPPCKILMPQIMLLYEELRARDVKFEVIYVSFDSDADAFGDYFSFMPWLAMDYNDEEKREELAVTYNIRGIPKFVLIDPNTQETIAEEGRTFVENDPMGESFPWKDGLLPKRASAKVKKTDEKAKAAAEKAAAKAAADAAKSPGSLGTSSKPSTPGASSNGSDKDRKSKSSSSTDDSLTAKQSKHNEVESKQSKTAAGSKTAVNP